jgi:DNA-binding PadR family transcriptional regulator
LGLLIEQPGNSYQLEQRLEQRFGSAQFAHGTAYQAMKRLSKQGLISAIEGDESAVLGHPKAAYPPTTVYEATTEGVEHFEGWLRASTSTPAVREDLLAKIAFCEPADLPRLIEIVREAEMTCAAQLEDLKDQARKARRQTGDDEWRPLMGMIATAADGAWWDARIKWLQTLRHYLQREGQRYEAARAPAFSLPRA